MPPVSALSPPPLGDVRLERAVTPATRIVLGLAGMAFGVGPWLAEASDAYPSAWIGLDLLLVPTTVIGGLLLAGSAAGRSTVTTVEHGSLVIRRLPSPLLGERIDRFHRHQIERVEVREDFDEDRPRGQRSRWDVCVHLVGRRRPLGVTVARPDRARANGDAAAIRTALGLPAD